MKRVILPSVAIPNIQTYIGKANELVVNETTGFIHVFDGKTPGGRVIHLDGLSKEAIDFFLGKKVDTREVGESVAPLYSRDTQRLLPPANFDIEDHMNDPRNGYTAARLDGRWVNIDYPPMVFLPGDETVLATLYDQYHYTNKVPANELIDARGLMEMVGLGHHEANEYFEGWVRFRKRGQLMFIADAPIISELTWDELYERGLVYGVDGPGSHPEGGNVNQNTIVTIGGFQYRLRLLKGQELGRKSFSTIPPDGYYSNYFQYSNGTSEFQDIGYYFIGTNNYKQYQSYSKYSVWNTGTSWLQEHNAADLNERLAGGGSSMRYGYSRATTYETGWRPVLELVGNDPYHGGFYETHVRSNTDFSYTTETINSETIGSTETITMPPNRLAYVDKVEVFNSKTTDAYIGRAHGTPRFGERVNQFDKVVNLFYTFHPDLLLIESHDNNNGYRNYDFYNTKTYVMQRYTYNRSGLERRQGYGCAVSGDGTKVFISDHNAQHFIDLLDDRQEVTLNHADLVGVRRTIALNYDGSLVVGVCENATVPSMVIIDTNTWGVVAKVPEVVKADQVSFSPDGRFLVILEHEDTSSTHANLRVYETKTWTLAFEATDITDVSSAKAMFINGGANLLYLVNDSGTTVESRSYDLGDWSYQNIGNLVTLGLGTPWDDVMLSPNEQWLSVSASNAVAVFNTSTWSTIALPSSGVLGSITMAGFAGDDKQLLITGADNARRVISLSTEDWTTIRRPNIEPFGNYTIDGVTFSQDGRLAAAFNTLENRLIVRDMDLETDVYNDIRTDIDFTRERGGEMSFSPDGLYLAIADDAAPNYRVLNTSDWSLVTGTPDVVADTTQSVQFNHDGSLLAIGHYDNTGGSGVTLLNTSDWSVVADFPAVGIDVDRVAFSPNDRYLVAWREIYHDFFMVDLSTMTQVTHLESEYGSTNAILGVSFSPDSKKMVIVEDNDFHQYDLESGKLLRSTKIDETGIELHLGNINTTSFRVGTPENTNWFTLTSNWGVAFIDHDTLELVGWISEHLASSHFYSAMDHDAKYVFRYSGGSTPVTLYTRERNNLSATASVAVIGEDISGKLIVYPGDVKAPARTGERNVVTFDDPVGLRKLRFITLDTDGSYEPHVKVRVRGHVLELDE